MQAPKQATVRSVQTLLTGTGIRLVCVLDGHRRATRRARAKVRIEDRRIAPALPPTLPCLASYTRSAVGSILQLHYLSTLSPYFLGVFRADRAFLRSVAFLSGGLEARRYAFSPYTVQQFPLQDAFPRKLRGIYAEGPHCRDDCIRYYYNDL
jgi:hypothetical protein